MAEDVLHPLSSKQRVQLLRLAYTAGVTNEALLALLDKSPAEVAQDVFDLYLHMLYRMQEPSDS